MKWVLFLLFVFVLLVGFVSAEADWLDDEVYDENLPDDVELDEDDDEELVDSDDDDEDSDAGSDISGGETASGLGDFARYTQNFWIALGVGAGVLFIFLLLLFLLLKRPRNRWKKK